MRWPKPPTGPGWATAWLKQLLFAAQASELKAVPGFRVNRKADGTYLELITPPGRGGASAAPVQVQRFYLKEILYDTLRCRLVGDTTPTDYFILRPTKLSCSVSGETLDDVGIAYAYDLSFVHRTATIGGFTEAQVIVPRYLANDAGGDVIYATRLPTPIQAGGHFNEIVSATHIDLNVDGRAWATVDI